MPRSTHSSRFGANAEEKPTASEEELEEERRREREAEAERKRAASALTPTPRRRSPEGARQGPRRRASDRGAFDRSIPGSRSGPRAWRSKRARLAVERGEPATPERSASRRRAARFYQLRPASWSDTGSGVGARGSRAARADRRGGLPEYLTAHLREEREQRGRERHEREQEQAVLRAQIRAHPQADGPRTTRPIPSRERRRRGEDRPPSEPAVDSRSCRTGLSTPPLGHASPMKRD